MKKTLKLIWNKILWLLFTMIKNFLNFIKNILKDILLFLITLPKKNFLGAFLLYGAITCYLVETYSTNYYLLNWVPITYFATIWWVILFLMFALFYDIFVGFKENEKK